MGWVTRRNWFLQVDPEYVRDKNLEGYNRIAQYYFRPGEYNSEVDGSRGDSDDDINSDIE